MDLIPNEADQTSKLACLPVCLCAVSLKYIHTHTHTHNFDGTIRPNSQLDRERQENEQPDNKVTSRTYRTSPATSESLNLGNNHPFLHIVKSCEK